MNKGKDFLDHPDKLIIIKEKSSGTLVKTTRLLAHPYLVDGTHVIVPKQKLKSFLNQEAKLFRKKRLIENHRRVMMRKNDVKEKAPNTTKEL